MLVLELLAFVALSASVVPSVAVQTPHKRTYDTHKYYNLELSAESTSSHANSIIKSIGAELVEPLGELPGHWLVRVPGITPHELTTSLSLQSRSADPVLERWSALRKRTRRSGKSDHQLRSLTPLSLRKRTKRGDPPPPSLRRSRIPHLSQPMVSDEETLYRRDDTELLMAQDSLGIADPMLNLQWHLINQELKDIELNVTGSWAKGITGKGVKVAIIDDGLDVNSDDLHDNFFAEGSWDYNDHTELPLPRLSDDQHGTRCAGEIGAVKNDVCGVGVAYESNIAGVRILSAPISDADEAAALNYAYQLNDIYSCSWGPPDDGKSMEAPDGLILKAMVNGVQKGRGGKGSVFVFAAGNGGGMEDQCNFDGYTNSIFSVTVGAVDRKGLHPYYSELCSAMMFVAPSSGSGDHIHTTDVGKNKCAHSHGGTSAAAPLAAGVFALVLQARPDLSWRDLQHLAVRSSIFFNPDDPDWETTKAGRKFSYKYGYGRIDAYGIVEMSRDWKLVKPQAWFDSPAIRLPDDPDTVAVSGRQVPGVPQGGEPQSDEEQQGGDDAQGDGDDGVETNPPPVVKPSGTTITPEGIRSSFEVTEEMLKDSNFETLEHITVRVWIEHQRRGDVEVEIVSPNGIRSVLARIRRFDEADTGFPGWKFMSLKHWEENPLGTWTITVKDTVNPNKTGRFVAWSLQLWGECIDAAEAKLWAPAEEGAPDEEEIGSDPTVTQSQKPKPTDHLPDDHGEAEGEAHKPGLGGTTDVPAPTPGTDITEGEGDADGDNDSSDADSGYFDGIKSLAGNPMWMAGAGLIVVLAGATTGLIFILRARKRRNNLFGLSNNGEGARGVYAPVSEDVPMGLLERGRRKLGGGGAAAGAGGSKDLYDAFGDGPSDDEDNGSDGSNERTALRYHDDFLDDDGEDGAGNRSPVYKDEPDTPTKESGSGGLGESASGASSSSWQDAAEDVPPRI